MTKEEKIEYTKNCLSLLGYVCVTPDDKDFRIYEGKNNVLPNMIDANFNDGFINNWNWIMEVVDAIVEKTKFKTIDECSEEEWYATIGITRLTITSKKEAVVQAINQFLIWYKK